jgi:hypothetical protein
MLCAGCAKHDESVDRPDGESARPAYRTSAVTEKSKAEVANLLALVALPAFGVAFLAGWSVLGDSAFAVKFENGEVPPGTDIATAQTAAWITVGGLLFGVTRVVAAVFILTTIAAPVYIPVAVLVYGLAF